MNQENIEKTGKSFDQSEFFCARELALEATQEILNSLEEGMNSKVGHQLTEEILRSKGSKKRWHPTKFRIGSDTLKTFKDQADETIKIAPGELVFIDIGPVFGDHEADIGRTTVYGEPKQEYQALSEAAQSVFKKTKNDWQKLGLTGHALYQRADKYAQELGYELNHDMAGHRLADFPHALISREGLSSVDFSPTENLWVLEIHLRCKNLNRGAFFEDLL